MVELQNVKISVFKSVLLFYATNLISFIRLIKFLYPPPIYLHAKPNFNLFVYISIVRLEMLSYRHWLLLHIGGFSVILWLNRILMISLQIFVLMLMNGCLLIITSSFDYASFAKNIRSVAIWVLIFHEIFRGVRSKKMLGEIHSVEPSVGIEFRHMLFTSLDFSQLLGI